MTRHRVGYRRILETNEHARHLLDFVQNHGKNAVFPFSEEQDLRVKVVNIVGDRIRTSGYVRHRHQALMIKQTISDMPYDEQLRFIYENYPEHFGSIIAKNEVFEYLKDHVKTHDLNRTRIFRDADFSVKVANIVRTMTSLTGKSAERYNSHVMDTVMDLLRYDRKKQIAYMVRTGRPTFLIKSRYHDLEKYVEDNTPLLKGRKYKFTTKCFWILHGIRSFDDVRFRCPVCGKSILAGNNVYEIWKGYRRYCSDSCRANDPSLQHIVVKTGWNTKKLHGTTNSSKAEERMYEGLCRIYGKDNVKRNYDEDRRYPFHCDFYVKTTDTFIECNLYWMHGGHFFDEASERDMAKLRRYAEKSRTHKAYEYAVKVWTKSDLAKRDTAVQNKLNYVVLWTDSDIDAYLKGIEKDGDN